MRGVPMGHAVDTMLDRSATTERTPEQQALFETRREREFYRYYDPIRQLSEDGPAYCDLHSNAAVDAHRAVSSPDRALTSFCQLGALRLQAKRAMVFFFDSNYAYILAEATRTLSLNDDANHDIEDHLWLGSTFIPRGYSVCEHTANLPANSGSNRFDDSADFAHIVNDLTDDVRFCDQPYVTDGPKARFYAGVPITTPNGINIGAFCVLDDKKREGVREKDLAFLRDMSETIMLHLDMVRIKAEHHRATSMMNGLGTFMREASESWDSSDLQSDRGGSRPPILASGIYQSPAIVPETVTGHFAPNPPAGMESVYRDRRVPEGDRVSDSTNLGLVNDAPPELVSRDSQSTVEETMSTTTSVHRSGDDGGFHDKHVPTEIHTMFQRAAHIAREAVQFDGVAFLDASIGEFAGLVNSADEDDADGDSGTGTTTRDTSVSDREDTILCAPEGCSEQQTSCPILGFSFAPALNQPNSESPMPPNRFDQKLLRTFLRRYPNGKIWNFSEDGSTSDVERLSGYEAGSIPDAQTDEASDLLRRASRRKRRRLEENRALQRAFPGVRGLALTGMRDHSTGRWYAGCFVWTYSPIRILSNESDRFYMAAFCDLIFQEISRMEARQSEKAKSDFVSSISHELRSPLHGILGTVECLQEEERLDAFCQGLISKIDVCGRTLIDIINHLLDFSEMSHHASAAEGNGKIAPNNQRRRSTTNTPRPGGFMSIEEDVALDRMTEEVIETAVYSYLCGKELHHQVDVILDIDHSSTTDWNCRLPTGAWKRICINLVNNALKYTDQGHILVTLAAHPIANKRKRFNCVLTVTDTGRGMSRDFLENLLFRPFTQEDSLNEGTGLGISLISKIVKNLKGKIEVQSEKGVGTKFIVTMPMERSRRGAENLPTRTTPPPLSKAFSGLSIGIVGSEDENNVGLDQKTHQSTTGQAIVLANLRKTCAHLGIETTSAEIGGMGNVDFHFILQKDLEKLTRTPQSDSNGLNRGTDIDFTGKPLIVLCNDAYPKRNLSVSQGAQWLSRQMVYICQPCGPQNLAEAIEACLVKKTGILPNTGILATAVSNGLHSTYEALDHMTADLSNLAIGRDDQVTAKTKVAERSPPILATSKTRPDSGISLLIVDDNHINLQLLETFAAKKGHSRLTAVNGVEAIERYTTASTRPQYVLMDINMPVMNGFEATRQIRQFEKLHRLPPATVIALTGLGSAEAQNEAYISGVDVFLTKPVRLKELASILKPPVT